MASSMVCSSSRGSRFVPLTKLDIAPATGKVQLPGDTEADAEEASLCDPLRYGLDEYDGWDVQNDDWAYDDGGDDN